MSIALDEEGERRTLPVEAELMRLKGLVPLPMLITLPNPRPVVAPALRRRTLVHRKRNSFSFLISIPIPWSTRRTSASTSAGVRDDKAVWSTSPVWTRILASSADRVELGRNAALKGGTVDVADAAAVSAG